LTLGKVAQSKPQVPQFLGSVWVSTQVRVHSVGVGAEQFGVQMKGVDEVWQRGEVAGQALTQLPHVRGSLRLASQPSSGWLEQCAKPDTHALAGTKQAPERHSIPVAPARTLGSVAQLCPQVPQLERSDWVSTHCDPQRSGAGAAQLEEQAGAPVVVEQSAVGATHCLPHCPQVAGRVRSVSQPSSARVEQWAKLAAHALGGTKHKPTRHSMPVAPGRT